MSLIQVSSNSKREASFLTQQEGYRFSNIFNGVLEVPPFSEIALHSGQFTIDVGGGTVNFEMIGGNSGNQFPVVRLQLAPTENTYMTDQEGIRTTPTPTTSTTAPFMYFVPRKKFKSIGEFWTEMVEYLKLDPRPQLQTTYAEDGTQLTGISVDTVATNSVQTPSFTITSNICPDATSIISASVFKTLLLGTDAITLAPLTGTISKSSGTQGTATQPSIFYTQSNGIHNGGGTLEIGGFLQPAISTSNNTRNEMVIGIKRWGYKTSPTDISTGWAEMASCPSAVPALTNYVATSGNASIRQYLASSLMFNQGGYGLPADSICDFAFHITGKTTGLAGNLRTGITSNGWTYTAEAMCCNIMKYEVGTIDGDGSPSVPRWVMIATGDPLINSTVGIPYSKQLDPESNLATWVGKNLISTTGNIGATDNKIVITGNTVSFVINGVDVEWLPSVASQVATPLYDFISDAVYPLQVAGTIYKTNNAFTTVRISSATPTQTEVKNLGRTYPDYAKYKSLRQIIPAEIYNKNFTDISPRCFYPLTTRTEPTSIGLNIQSGAIEANTYLYLDTTEDGDIPTITTPVNYQPNIMSLVGSLVPRLSFVSDDDYATASNNYSVDVIQNPMLIGLYIRLKNLTQKTTMGSINSVDNDKLIAIVNRYDHTNDESNLSGFPIYSYNEYDRLYVALNNPSPLYLSQLDFEIVDKFGTVISAIKNTTLVLHMRPATYKELYGYKKGL